MKTKKKWLDNPRYVRHAAAAADLFCARFSPDVAMSETSVETRANEIRAKIKRDVEHDMVEVRCAARFAQLFAFFALCPAGRRSSPSINVARKQLLGGPASVTSLSLVLDRQALPFFVFLTSVYHARLPLLCTPITPERLFCIPVAPRDCC